MARPRDPDIDLRVVQACVELLGEVGRAGLSRASIARRAGVSLPAVHRRFADVEEILRAVAGTPPAPPPTPPGEVDDPPATLREFLVATLTRMARALAAGDVRRQAAELMAAAIGDPSIDATFRETLQGVRAEGREWVERARRSGEVRPDVDADLLLDLVVGSTYYRLLWRAEALHRDDVEHVVDTVLLGAVPRIG